MERRKFIRNGFLSGAAMASGTALMGAGTMANVKARDGAQPFHTPEKAAPFRLKFSPEFGIFADTAGKDPVDQIRWGYDNGFRAWENTGLKSRPVAEQERISKAVQQLGMEFGQFVGTMTFSEVTFAGQDLALRDQVLKDVRESVEIAKRMNTKFVHNVLGLAHPSLPYDFQMVNAVELLKRIADIYEPHGIIMVMETMNHKINHPGMFLHTIPQAYALARAVGAKVEIDVERIVAMNTALGHRPSILQDLMATRPMEIDSQYTVPLGMAQAAGVPMPTLELLAALIRVRAREAGLYAKV